MEGIISGDGRWKLHLPHTYRTLEEPGRDGQAGKYNQESIDTSLYDMANDPLESENLISVYPDTARQLIKYAESHKLRFYSK